MGERFPAAAFVSYGVNNMAATRLIALHVNKEKTLQQSLEDRLLYAENPEKTEDGTFITSYECDIKSAKEEFTLAKARYDENVHRKWNGNIIAYQIRQSFKPGEVSAEEANRIGYETAMRFTKGKHAFVVCTHTDKPHFHNHIIFNSTALDEKHKFKDFFFSGIALQRLSDVICLEHGLSVITPARPSERVKRTTYPKRKPMRANVREAVDIALAKKPATFEDFLFYLSRLGYEIKRGKHTAVRGENQKRFIRLNSLGAGYREADIREYISNQSGEKVQDGKNVRDFKKRDFDLLLNIQDIISKGKGYGYEHWAKVHNIKIISKMLLFLQEHDCRDYETLEKRASESAKKFSDLSKKIKACDEKLDEIASLRNHIFTYAKTKDIYIEYKKHGYSKKFYEANMSAIDKHKAAKEAFENYTAYTGEKIPNVKSLNAAFSKIAAEKKAMYKEYHEAKQFMKDYQIAKRNIDELLNLQREEQEIERENNRNRKKEEASL